MTGGRGNICHGFAAVNPAFFGDPTVDGQKKIYTHGEKEIAAMAERRAKGIPVNNNTMVEIWDLCQHLGLDFSAYFGDYRPIVKEDVFKGNY